MQDTGHPAGEPPTQRWYPVLLAASIASPCLHTRHVGAEEYGQWQEKRGGVVCVAVVVGPIDGADSRTCMCLSHRRWCVAAAAITAPPLPPLLPLLPAPGA